MRLLIFALAFCASACASRGEAQAEPTQPVPATGSLCLDPSTRRVTTQHAEGGDISAMKALATHYDVCGEGRETMLKWLRAAADAGDADSREYVVLELNRLGRREEAEDLAKTWGLDDLIK